MSDRKRAAFDIKAMSNKIARLEARTHRPAATNPFLKRPVDPTQHLCEFLMEARQSALNYSPQKPPFTKAFAEIECRLGLLTIQKERRVCSSGSGGKTSAFASAGNGAFVSGTSRLHFVEWTDMTQVSRIAKALGCNDMASMKSSIVETNLTETVYVGYPNERRCTMPAGTIEYKEKLKTNDMVIPAAKYDVRINLSSEIVVERGLEKPKNGWTRKRIKRRKSYTRKSMVWQIDVTTVNSDEYEIEMELVSSAFLDLLNDSSPVERIKTYAKQLWWILECLNPRTDNLSVESELQDHPKSQAVQLALEHCRALQISLQSGSLQSPLLGHSANIRAGKFMGCMPVNFARHDLDKIQQHEGYFISEKTDGVRHLMVFTGKTVVLVDRAQKGKRPKTEKDEPFAKLIPKIPAGTVLDGEVVMHRGKKSAIFIVFDVLSRGSQPVLQLPFAKRLELLKSMPGMDDWDTDLPLLRKNFVPRTRVDELLSHVREDKGLRLYQAGSYNHLTDGIIFQPNSPYVCGTDHSLLKWKYLDTATVDVEITPSLPNDDDDVLRVACLGDEHTRVDMTRHVRLPLSERLRLNADRAAGGGNIAEVGFEPSTGDWYYLCLRPDKVAPNHISTVMGTMLELAEALTTDELRYRMSVPNHKPDTFRKDVKRMMGQLLAHHRETLKRK